MLKHRNDWFMQKWSFSLLGKWRCGMWTLVSSWQRASDQINSLSVPSSPLGLLRICLSIYFRVINLHMLWNELQISWWKLIHVTVSVPGVQHIFTSWLLTDHQYCKACLRAKRMHLCSTHCFPVFWGPCDRQRPRQLIERSAWSNRILLKSLSHISWHGKKELFAVAFGSHTTDTTCGFTAAVKCLSGGPPKIVVIFLTPCYIATSLGKGIHWLSSAFQAIFICPFWWVLNVSLTTWCWRV